ncbi:MAG: hypothetical protein HW384_2219 [Dehalococcoidia bacterium]|nr:hypothetical protein [Dehalococcoidia bacterium]
MSQKTLVIVMCLDLLYSSKFVEKENKPSEDDVISCFKQAIQHIKEKEDSASEEDSYLSYSTLYHWALFFAKHKTNNGGKAIELLSEITLPIKFWPAPWLILEGDLFLLEARRMDDLDKRLELAQKAIDVFGQATSVAYSFSTKKQIEIKKEATSGFISITKKSKVMNKVINLTSSHGLPD